jgi:hypothetical protein
VSRLRPVAPLALALAVLAGACSSGSDGADLDVGKAEREIRKLTVKEYGEVVRVGGVRCPKTVEQKKGKTFTCTVAVDGQPLVIRVDQRDDQGNVHISQAQAVVSTAKAEDFVKEYAQRRETPLSSVACAKTKIVIRTPGQTITCGVKYEDGATGTARMQVGNVTGRVGIQRLTRETGGAGTEPAS